MRNRLLCTIAFSPPFVQFKTRAVQRVTTDCPQNCVQPPKRDDSCLKIWTKPQPKNAKIHFQLTCIVQKHLCLSSQLSTKDIKREKLIKQRHPTCIKKVKMSPMWRAWDKENMKTVFWILVIGLELRQHFCTFNTALKRDLRQSYMTHIKCLLRTISYKEVIE